MTEPLSTSRLDEIRHHIENDHTSSPKVWASRARELVAEIDRLRSPPDDAEVAEYVLRVRTIASNALEPGTARNDYARNDLHAAADLLTRLAASLSAMRERAEKAEAVAQAEVR